MIVLRPDQYLLKQDICNAWNGGSQNVLAVLATGGGKSIIASDIVLDANNRGAVQAVIAHRNELVGQMSLHVARRGIKHRIIGSRTTVSAITAEHRLEFGRSFINPDANCTVASVDTLIARADQLKQWSAQVDDWTIDECFPAGTLVQTVTGEQPIETIRVGDEVLAFDEKSGGFAYRKVRRLFKNPTPKHMVRIDTTTHHVLCTLGHPFWTARGWVNASELTQNDVVLSNERTLSHVRCPGTPHTQQQENRSRILQQDLQQCVSSQNIIGNDGAHQQATCVGTHETKQSNASRRQQRADALDVDCDETQTDGSRREREGTATSRTHVDDNAGTARIHCTILDQDRIEKRQGFADLLQTGHGTPHAQNSNRSGRQLSRCDCEATIRCDQRCFFDLQRVESIEVYQSTDNERSGDGYVYNIEVDDFHTYVANGIVVHNCHHVLRLNKWGKAVAMFPNAKGLGITASPQRADGMGLGRHHDGLFDVMVQGPDMRTLINMSALCDYEIAIPESDFAISDDEIAPSGDWSTAKMREASKKSHIVGDVVKEYIARAYGKRGICFATDVETANEIARKFEEAGIPTAAVSAKTPADVRNDCIRRFRDGRLWMLVNVDLFGEGFDVPAVEVVIMARPTASLAVYLQQFGRALRVLAGKPFGLVIDHVSNWKRHGFPDKAHYWSLDRRDKRAKREPDPEEIALTACRDCSRPYERCLPACPYCGWVPPLPEGGGRTLEQVDGDLMLLDRATLQRLRDATVLESPASMGQRVADAAGPLAGKGAINRQIERHGAQQRLSAAIAQWAGIQRHRGRSDQESYRRFYLTLGVDVLSALTLDRKDMESMADRVEGWCVL